MIRVRDFFVSFNQEINKKSNKCMQKCKETRKVLFIQLMRISVLQIISLFMLSGVLFANPGSSESILNKRLSISLKNVSLETALNNIQTRAAVKFVYSSTVIPLNSKVSVTASQEKLSDILTDILSDLGVNYTVNASQYIVLKRNELAMTDSLMINALLANQQHTVSGKVIGKADQKPFPGVSVVVKGTKTGTVTSADGSFKISVPNSESILVFTYISFQTQEVAVGTSRTINVELAESANALTEVVVTAAGIKREKTTLGYSVSTISSDKLAQKSEPDPLRALTGKVAGVSIGSSGGVAGGATNINIRGSSSLNGNNQPLFVVDGVPFDNSSFGNVGGQSSGGSSVTNRAFDLDPNNIQSMTVLKGAAAAALYGSRAANGAVIITTKAGKKMSRKGTEIAYNTSYSVENVSGLPEYQTKYGQGTNNDYRQGVYGSWGQPFPGVQSIIPTRATIPAQLTRSFSSAVFPQLYQADGVTPIQIPYRSYAEENAKNFFQTGSVYENALSISSGSEKGNLNAGFSRTNNTGVVPNNSINRTSFNISGNMKLDNKFYVSGSMNYVTTRQKTPPIGGATGSIMSALMYTPTSFDLTGNPYENPVDGSNVYDYTGLDNPYWSTVHSVSTSSVDRYYGNMVLGFDPLPWLNIQNTAGFNAYTDRRLNVRGKGSSSYSNGSIATDDIYRQELDNTFLVTATKKLTSDLSLRWILGNNVNQRLTDRKAFYGDGIIVADLNTITNTSSVTPIQLTNNRNLLKQRYYAFFTDITFDYKDYASLNLVGRNDISSTLPANNRSYFYGGANGSFIFTKALKMDDSFLSFGKVRGGYTRVGNESTAYQTAEFYLVNSPLGATTGVGSIGSPFTNSNGTYNSSTLANLLTNANLKPEFITELEVGTELQFFKNRIGLDFTYYNKKSTSQIFEVTAAPSSGFTTQILNLGEATNKGVEIALNLAPFRNPNGFSWDISTVFTRNRNVINDLGGYQQFVFGGANGTSSVHMVGSPYGLIYGTAYARDAAGEILIDPNTGKPLVSGSLKAIGNPNPDYILGITNSFTYKAFSLSVLFDLKKGGDMYSNTVGQMLSRGVTRDTENREGVLVSPGVLGNPATLQPLLDANGKTIPNNVGMSYEDLFFNNGIGPGGVDEGSIFDATVFRLREVSLAFQFPKSMLKGTPFGSGMISVTGRNLWYYAPNFPKYTNFDPEVSSLGVGNSQGYDNLSVPTTKRFGVNLRFTF
ncbi:TonB-linked outer membrane protein, SusC/RagA family [Pedobacter westerhofensis]|uniref:TonB-linked outer membrane protein, SusC/RagA family n=2 Tax=Pedobacter westerhofensis TaxID=425512 RepID=A0A521CD46_9SPHI|nr:TonB-linked outer membrane protein, SusC/RagA family [Pedobacter westerhofensis]